ncbi:hypothetical protein SAMN05444673_0790 [Bacillus sp. OV166]|nr:hypothetical protein SAMN05444673_0790 [Bacillus sp. OV166]
MSLQRITVNRSVTKGDTIPGSMILTQQSFVTHFNSPVKKSPDLVLIVTSLCLNFFRMRHKQSFLQLQFFLPLQLLFFLLLLFLLLLFLLLPILLPPSIRIFKLIYSLERLRCANLVVFLHIYGNGINMFNEGIRNGVRHRRWTNHQFVHLW